MLAFQHIRTLFVSHYIQTPVGSAITQSDEAAAVAAMFQAQTQNWEETQEKMSQLVSPFSAFCPCSSSESNEQCLFLSSAVLL
jgi:protein MPE1